MTSDHITNDPNPSLPPPPEPDDDVPPRRPPLDLWSSRSILAILAGGVGGAFFGLILGNVVGSTFLPHRLSILVGTLLGLLVGILGTFWSIYTKLGKGVRVVNRALPRGARPPQPRRVSSDNPHVVTRRDALALLGTLPPRHVSRLVGNHSRILAVALSADGKLALSAGNDGMVSLWDVQTGFEIRSLQAFRYHTHAVAFSPDGRLVTAAGLHVLGQRGPVQGGVLVWDAESGQLLRQIDFADAARALAFQPDGREIVIGSNANLRLWELDGPSPTALVPVETTVFSMEEIHAVAVSDEGKLVLAGCAKAAEMRLVNLELNEVVRRFTGHGMRLKVYRPAAVVSVAFSPNGMQALSGSWDQTAIVWNLLTGEPMVQFTGHRGFWGWRGVVGVAWLGNGDRAVSVSENGLLCVWDTKTGVEVKRHHHGAGVTCLATTMDGRMALTGGRDGVVRTWDLWEEEG